MDYYQCSTEVLYRELQRRAQATSGGHDQLSERLQLDDEERNSEATTVTTEIIMTNAPRDAVPIRMDGFSNDFPVEHLIDQKIVYWDLNTFFPTLQLFFKSGLSCTIDGSQLPGAIVGLDPILRFRLTDCTHAEQGWIVKGTLSEKFSRRSASITIAEAVTARRTSTRVRPVASTGSLPKTPPQLHDIVQEVHTVIGLRLNGMSEMGYIWAKAETLCRSDSGRIWGDARLAGLREDVPAPSLGLAVDSHKAGGELKVVERQSLIKLPAGVDEFGLPWI